ncbi:hypothetical protein VFPPC_18052 [Pochonia chlamydosporia 170]|uniref:Uncharacterized protein n=1 Tax=Pochonia chlamydosporia 170 TaxID=1380566 RepID=A0A219APQ8_METCM|nr:hypothetical protein VFPPC_18052 [Pochonia chlamydosporia 170]OWT42797.1 hypothetical protein VFPPC_18052 [Pochonia chlamydosporia 170]
MASANRHQTDRQSGVVASTPPLEIYGFMLSLSRAVLASIIADIAQYSLQHPNAHMLDQMLAGLDKSLKVGLTCEFWGNVAHKLQVPGTSTPWPYAGQVSPHKQPMEPSIKSASDQNDRLPIGRHNLR